jgi:amylosucrase
MQGKLAICPTADGNRDRKQRETDRMEIELAPAWLERQAALSLGRLLPRLRAQLEAAAPPDRQAFETRLAENFPTLFELLLRLYGDRYDFFYHLERILAAAAECWLARPAELKRLDAAREADRGWFQSERMLGGVCYVDLFAGNLAGIRDSIPYFRELGLTYLHLMPLFACPAGENDGGYAVSSYREVNPALGAMVELQELAGELRENGISLVVDFVFNHTSDEHTWAQRALAGEPEHQEYYHLFPDREMPDAYERTLREIFPDVRRGSFTYIPRLDRWVWTTFHSFQWDLNYGNPAVFRAMLEEMLFLANAGVEILRLDAVAFIWKKLGTSCENLPEAHTLIRAFNALARIAAPALLFKSEAIVHPDEVARYIGPGECQLSYNPLLMALLWESLATRKVGLLQHSLRGRFKIDPQCAWVNYVRCHDDIGWTFDDADAKEVGIDGFGHRQFLNAFYTGRFPGSFARGLPFQENPRTGDCRISGTCASLAGLEKALREETAAEAELAVRRILLMHGIILSIGGIPLLYLGDETGTLNDYDFREERAKARDSRWAHRPAADWERMARRSDPGAVEARIYGGLKGLIAVRRECPAFGRGEMLVVDSGNPQVFGYVRQGDGARVLALANFSEREQRVAANTVRLHGLSYAFTDLVTGQAVSAEDDLVLEAYRFVWLMAAGGWQVADSRDLRTAD